MCIRDRLAQLITAMQLASMGYPYRITWTLYPDTLLLTALFFLASFVVIGLFNIRAIRRIKVIDMLQADKVNESLKKSRWMHGVIFVFSLFLIAVLATGIDVYKRQEMSRGRNRTGRRERI